MWRLLLFTFIPLATAFEADSQSYDLENAPWSGEAFEVCPTANANGLRAVIFEPVLERGTRLITVTKEDLQLYPAPNERGGYGEKITRFKQKVPATYIYLKEQRVAYLNNLDQWVNADSLPLKNFKDFENHQGDRNIGAYEIFHPDDYPNLDHDAWDAKNRSLMETAPNCSSQYVMGPWHPVTETVARDYGPNNPLVCSENGSLVHGDALNDTYTIYRDVVKYTHGEALYLKGPNGKVYAFYGLRFSEFLNAGIDPDNVCEWKVIPISKNHKRGIRMYSTGNH